MGTVEAAKGEEKEDKAAPAGDKRDALTIRDERTGRVYEVPIAHGTIRATDLRQIKTGPEDFGLMTYDPAFMNTASCAQPHHVHRRRQGHPPVPRLSRSSSSPRSAPTSRSRTCSSTASCRTRQQFERLGPRDHVPHDDPREPEEGHGRLPLQRASDGDAHRDGRGAVDLLPGGRDVHDPAVRTKQIAPPDRQDADDRRLRLPALDGHALRLPGQRARLHRQLPEDALQDAEPRTTSRTRSLVRALDVLFILHADHEQNCGTNAMRGVGARTPTRTRRWRRRPRRSTARSTAAPTRKSSGCSRRSARRTACPAFIKEVKEGKGEKRLMGFGHRVYKNYDPRAKIIKRMAEEVFEVTGRNPLLDIALELERIALQDEYFVKRKLYPNVDFYSGLIYQAIGFPTDMFPVLFAIPRTSGWLAQWEEMLEDPEQKIARPRQMYLGEGERAFVPMEKR